MNLFRRNLRLLLILLLMPVWAEAAVTNVKDVRLWTAPDHTRIVFDLDGRVTYNLFRMHGPERIVIDIDSTHLKAPLNKLELPDPVIQSIRHAKHKDGALRIVLDVKEKVQPRSFLLKPMHGKPYRIVVDLTRPELARKEAVSVGDAKMKKGLLVAIDAGHGGEDPGAIGPNRIYEKNVTLAVAKELAKIVNAEPGMRAMLTRTGDYFVPLRKRVLKARKAQADVFISIHADAVKQQFVEGASVYTLSELGATQDKAARALAAKENAADEVGGVSFDEVDDPLVSRILGDMFRRDSLNSSQMLAEEMIGRLKGTGPIKYDVPKRARFVVLSAMEIPSVLVELDYISNPERAKKLNSSPHQRELAKALFNGSVSFFTKMGRLKQQAEGARMMPESSLQAANL